MTETNIINVLNEWKQFIPYLITHVASFKDIIVIAKTCKTINHYCRASIKIYALICDYYVDKVSVDAFTELDIPKDLKQRQVLQEIYNIYKESRLRRTIKSSENIFPIFALPHFLLANIKTHTLNKLISEAEKKKTNLDNLMKDQYPDLF